jgi:hypothetical protein
VTKFRNAGNLTDLADGSIAEPGAEVDLSKEAQNDPHNQALIESGRLVATTKAATKAANKEGVTSE